MTASSRAGALLALWLCGCGSAASRGSTSEHVVAPSRANARLVVVVVVDQLAGWTLDRYERVLDPRGAIRQGSARGVHARVRYPYSSTVTACGHAAIYTGAAPASSGVIANEVYDRARGGVVSVFDDGEHPVLGAEGAFGSPSAIRAETVADAHDRATGGAARIVSVSLKDRGAIPGGGARADAVVWYDKANGRFTTSTAYADSIPAWLEAWSSEHPLESALTVWTPLDEALLERIAGPDSSPGEGDYEGLGTTFPHDLARAADPRAAVRVAPQGTELLLSLSEAAVEANGLGEDEVPDLLAISISGTDYAGHVYGPSSWEYVDHLIRADRALGELLRRLGERTSIAVLITSDHGVAPLPEAARDQGPSGRIADAEIVAAVEAGIDAALGPGDWVEAFVEPYVYLSRAAEEPDRRARATAAAIAALDGLESVRSSYDVREALRLARSEDELERAVALSLRPDSEGDVFVVPAERFVFDPGMPGGSGTNHGSPWEHDRVVPVVFWGPSVSPSRPPAPYDQRRVAPTISALLGSASPREATSPPLPGAP